MAGKVIQRVEAEGTKMFASSVRLDSGIPPVSVH